MWILFHQRVKDMFHCCFYVIEYKNRPITLTFYCCALIMYKAQYGIFHRQQVTIISHDTIVRTRTKLWYIVGSYCIGTYYIRIHTSSGSSIPLDTIRLYPDLSTSRQFSYRCSFSIEFVCYIMTITLPFMISRYGECIILSEGVTLWMCFWK